jgi:hypothetical protein
LSFSPLSFSPLSFIALAAASSPPSFPPFLFSHPTFHLFILFISPSPLVQEKHAPAMAVLVVNKNILSLVTFILSAVFLLATYHRSNLFPDSRGSHGPGGPHKPRYIFVDLGANRADSLEAFLKHQNAKFQYDFPRPDWATHDQAGEYSS